MIARMCKSCVRWTRGMGRVEVLRTTEKRSWTFIPLCGSPTHPFRLTHRTSSRRVHLLSHARHGKHSSGSRPHGEADRQQTHSAEISGTSGRSPRILSGTSFSHQSLRNGPALSSQRWEHFQHSLSALTPATEKTIAAPHVITYGLAR